MGNSYKKGNGEKVPLPNLRKQEETPDISDLDYLKAPKRAKTPGIDEITKSYVVKVETPLKGVTGLSGLEVEEVDWFLPGVMPKGQVTLLGAAGGIGKGYTWAKLAADATRGYSELWDVPMTKVKNACILSAEDSVRSVILPRLIACGADTSRLCAVEMSSEFLSAYKTDSAEMRALYEAMDFIIIDPLQSFIDGSINMGYRNQMRQALEPLQAWGEKFNTTTLIVMHVNKRDGAWGRNKLADSSDIWDIARSVLMMGRVPPSEGDYRYVSQEKNNYGRLARSIITNIDWGNNRIYRVDFDDRHDFEFVTAAQDERSSKGRGSTPAYQYVAEDVIEVLKEQPGKRMSSKELREVVDCSDKTWENATNYLKRKGFADKTRVGFGKGGTWVWFLK